MSKDKHAQRKDKPPKPPHKEVKRFRPKNPNDYLDPDYDFKDEEDIRTK